MNMRRSIISLILCLVMISNLFAAQAQAAAVEPAWAEPYEQVLADQVERAFRETEGIGVGPDIWYLVYDVDKDGTPELLVKYGTCEADYRGVLYTFRNNRAFQVGEDLFLGHSSFYSDPGEDGIILMHGHMGYAWAVRISITDGYAEEALYEDDLNPRLENDPNAEYIYPGDVIPGSMQLTLCRWDVTLPLTHYEEIARCLDGVLPEVKESYYPNRDENYYSRLMADNSGVFAVTADGYTNSPEWIGFQDLLRQDIASDWMQGDLSVLSATPADLNGDGKLECVVAASDGSSEMRIVLSEQDGIVYAYLLNYTDNYTLEPDGSFLWSFYSDTVRYRMIFDGAQAFMLILPDA